MMVIVMFDLPTLEPEDKREYRRFHDNLEKLGFTMMQFSVYSRPCSSPEQAEVTARKVKNILPPEGEVRVFALTALQMHRMQIFYGNKKQKKKEMPDQITLF